MRDTGQESKEIPGAQTLFHLEKSEDWWGHLGPRTVELEDMEYSTRFSSPLLLKLRPDPSSQPNFPTPTHHACPGLKQVLLNAAHQSELVSVSGLP